jgi:choline dehydrogenase-like flavoprotein
MYADRARKAIGISRLPNGALPWESRGQLPPDIDYRKVILTAAQFPADRDLSARLLEQIEASENVTLALHANVIDVRLNREMSAVSGLAVRNDFGTTILAKGKQFVIALGGIETPRLLLASKSQEARGIGNLRGMVGQGVHDRTRMTCAQVFPRRRIAFDRTFADWHLNGQRYQPQLILAEEAVRSLSALGVGGRIVFDSDRKGVDALRGFKKAWNEKAGVREVFRSGAEAVRELPIAAGEIHAKSIAKRSYAPSDAQVYLEAFCGQPPANGSSIRLGTDVDAMGVPRALYTHRVHRSERESILNFAEMCGEELKAVGLASRTALEPALLDEERFEDWCSPEGLVMGGTRMSLDPARGVVDMDLKVHGLKNLYCAGASVFPSSGAADPTLTLFALNCRLADHLQWTLRSSIADNDQLAA